MPALAGVAMAVAVAAGGVAIQVVSAVMRPAPTRQQATLRLATQCNALHKVGVVTAVVVAVMAATTNLNGPLKASLIRCAPAWT